MAIAVQVRNQHKTQYDHLFFPGMAVLILAAVFLGFAQTYYLGGVLKLPDWKAGAGPPHPLLVHIHAVIFSSWTVLLVVQTSLIAGRRVAVHRRLGLIGFGLACLLVLAGLAVTCEALARNAPLGDPKLKFPFLQIVDMTVFSTLIYFGYRERFNPAAHKRLTLIATVTLLDAAFVRWPVPLIGKNFLAAELCCYSLLVILASYDLWFTGKFHRATIWGSALVILAHHPILSILNQNVIWHRFAIWMQTVGRFLH
jgi:hypothetical protein